MEATHASLSGLPPIDFQANIEEAMRSGIRLPKLALEAISLWRGPGKLTPNEYFYYRLWDKRYTPEQKRAYVGKQAQHPMHMACNDTAWLATAADKLVFQTIMEGVHLPVPELLAVTDPSRLPPSGLILLDEAAIAAFLRDARNYPLFAKPMHGKYSLSVVSADSYDCVEDKVHLRGGYDPMSPDEIAQGMKQRREGYIVQRRMSPDCSLARTFGSRLWSVRALVLSTADGPIIHGTAAKIATGENPADNYWRGGNMLGAVDAGSGTITRVVRGTGLELVVDEVHPDTGAAILGTVIPNWHELTQLVLEAAKSLPGIRTQSWDVAITDAGPILIEVNFGGDLNLLQLSSGVGVLDDVYRAHLVGRGYKF